MKKYSFKSNLFFIVLSSVIILAIMEIIYSMPIKVNINNESVENIIELPVIMYHHLSTKAKMLGDYVISPEIFENDLKYLKENGYQTITLTELVSFLEYGSPLPSKPIVITFDDGNESVQEYALPLLKKYDMTAVIMVLGKFVDIFSDENEKHNINYSHSSWSQLREMQQSGIFEIGNHTYDMHHNESGKRYGIKMTKNETLYDYKQALYDDIFSLSKKIETEIGVYPIAFAYPYGAFSKESKEILSQMGFKILFTCEEKINKLSPHQEFPVSLKRFNRPCKYTSVDFFEKIV